MRKYEVSLHAVTRTKERFLPGCKNDMFIKKWLKAMLADAKMYQMPSLRNGVVCKYYNPEYDIAFVLSEDKPVIITVYRSSDPEGQKDDLARIAEAMSRKEERNLVRDEVELLLAKKFIPSRDITIEKLIKAYPGYEKYFDKTNLYKESEEKNSFMKKYNGMSKSKIYLIAGPARNGKDTTAECIKRYLTERGIDESVIIHESFAAPLKKICRKLGWDGNKDEDGRFGLQVTGDAIKAFHHDDAYFAKECVHSIMSADGQNDKVKFFFVTDMRFKSEYYTFKDPNLLKKFDVYFIRVTRPGDGVTWNSGMTEEAKHHASEIDLNDIEFENNIVNDGTIEDLYNKIVKLYPNLVETTGKDTEKNG